MGPEAKALTEQLISYLDHQEIMSVGYPVEHSSIKTQEEVIGFVNPEFVGQELSKLAISAQTPVNTGAFWKGDKVHHGKMVYSKQC